MNTEPTRAGWRERVDAAIALRLLTALLLAVAVCLAAWLVYPRELDIQTDIVGNPIFTGFNVRRYSFDFLLLTVALPLLTGGFFYAFERLTGRSVGAGPFPEWLPQSVPASEPDPDQLDRREAWASPYLRLTAVGALLALAVAVQVSASSSWLLTLLVPVTLGYVLVARGIAAAVARSGRATIDQATAAVNAIFAGFSLLVLAVASHAAVIKVVAPPSTAHYPFAPAWALIAAGLIAGAVVTVLIVRSAPARWRRIELVTLLSLVSGVAVYLLIAQMAGQQGPPDLFHDGERLGASRLVSTGAFPWRDILFPHGLLSDVGLPALDRSAIDDSRWGMFAGRAMLEAPLFWVSSFLLCAWLFRRNWLFLVGAELMLAFGWIDTIDNDRMMLLPLGLLALAALLARATWPRAIALMAVTLAQAIAVPEATGYSAAIWAVVVAFEIVHRRCPQDAQHPWARTLRIAVAGAGWSLAFAVYLVANHALDDFFEYYKTFVGGHDLTGGLPLVWADPGFDFKVIFPVVVILVAWAYAGVRIWTRRWFTIADWVVGASILGLIPYYLKFLTRADAGHLYQVAAVAIIPALYVVYRVIEVIDERGRRSGHRWLGWRPATVVFLAVVVVGAPASALTRAKTLPTRLTGIAFTPRQSDRLGYTVAGSFPDALPDGVQKVVDRYTAGGGSVFDFTNSPLLFDYLINDRPATRFYHVSMAIPAAAQQTVIDELEAERPALVAYSSVHHGLPEWDDIPNPVRHYLISDYLLDNYRPVAKVGDYVFMARDDVPRRPGAAANSRSLYFDGFTCDWGLTPEFLDRGPESGAESVDLPLGKPRPGTVIDASGWAGSLRTGYPATEVLFVRGDRIVSSTPTGAPRADIAYASGFTGLGSSGFDVNRVLIPGYPRATNPLRFYGLARDGTASELQSPTSGGPQPRVLRGPGGERVRVRDGAVDGSVDGLTADPLRLYKLSLPADAADYNWLTVDSAEPFGDDHFLVTDSKPGPARAIAFDSRAGHSTSLSVEVGSCPQWHGYSPRDVSFGVTANAGPVEARLTR